MDFPNIKDSPRIGYDTETTGTSYPLDKVFGFAVAVPTGESWYWDLRETPRAVEWLNDQMLGFRGLIASHNASFDYRMSKTSGIEIPIDNLDCTVIRACLLDEHRLDYSLDDLAYDLDDGLRKKTSIYQELAGIFGGLATRNVQMPNMPKAPSSVVGPYCSMDALIALRLWEYQEKEADRQEVPGVPSVRKVMSFERRCLPYIIRMECHGIRVDLDLASRAADSLTPMIESEQKNLNDMAGWNININSSPQIAKLFAPVREKTGWTVGGKRIPSTNSGNASFASETLRSLSEDPRAEAILSIRSLMKTRDTFLRGHVMAHAVNGRVYPNINQSKGEDGGTGTGRLAYNSPAMQQIPSRNKTVASIVKQAFLPDEGQVWLDADEASFEVRIFAHLLASVGETSVIDAYKKDPRVDFHQFVADLTGLPRNASFAGQANAKSLNLAQIFNSGNGAIAETMGMDWGWDTFINSKGQAITYKKAGTEAMDIINTYHRALPGVKKLAAKCKSTAENRGFIYTRSGRRLRFPGKWKTYKASGLLIQSTAADFNKENIMLACNVLEGYGGRLLLNTHDSYSISCPEDKLPQVWADLRGELEKADRANVPLLLDLSGYGSNWWDALNSKRSIPLVR